MAKILLVEPDINLAQTLIHSLKNRGHKIKVCATAQAAIHGVDSFKPDIVILELQLPVHNGIEFLYELRSYQDWQTVPVIVHSLVPPTLKAISSMLWDNLHIVAYHYKPVTKLATLNNSVDNILTTAQ